LMSAMADESTILALSGAGEFIVPTFHRLIDALYPLAKLLEFLAIQKTKLAEVVAALPAHHNLALVRVECSWDQKGTVMRLLNEQFKDQIVEQVDGVKIRVAEGEWVLVMPASDKTEFWVYAEAESPEDADALAKHYASIVEGMRAL